MCDLGDGRSSNVLFLTPNIPVLLLCLCLLTTHEFLVNADHIILLTVS